jgi:hypothetical protein
MYSESLARLYVYINMYSICMYTYIDICIHTYICVYDVRVFVCNFFFWPDIPQELVQMIEHCWHAKPDVRPKFADLKVCVCVCVCVCAISVLLARQA